VTFRITLRGHYEGNTKAECEVDEKDGRFAVCRRNAGMSAVHVADV
jgi:hypothetical protein